MSTNNFLNQYPSFPCIIKSKIRIFLEDELSNVKEELSLLKLQKEIYEMRKEIYHIKEEIGHLMCYKCKENKTDIRKVLTPCGHRILCEECILDCIECPKCSTKVDSIITLVAI
jgi:hypothetical protein